MSKKRCKADVCHEECNVYFEINWTKKTSMEDRIKNPMLSYYKQEHSLNHSYQQFISMTV